MFKKHWRAGWDRPLNRECWREHVMWTATREMRLAGRVGMEWYHLSCHFGSRERGAPAETYPPAHTFSRSMGQRPIFCWRVMTPIHILQWMGEKGRIATRANWVGLDTSWVRRHWFQQSLKTLEGGLRPLTALWVFMTKTHHIHNVCSGLCPLGDE